MDDSDTPAAGSPHVIVYSKGAGRRKTQNEQLLIREFFEEQNIPYRIVLFDRSRQRVEDLELAMHAREIGAERILVAGGDGTVRCIAEHVYVSGMDVSIGILPVGSANLLARILRMPLRLRDALTHAIRARPTALDIGILNKRHIFLLSACFGRLARITTAADHYNKRQLGFWAYVVSGARHLFAFPRKLIRLRSGKNLDRKTQSHSVLVFLRGTAQALVPGLRMRPEGLHVMTFHNSTFLELLTALATIYVWKKPSSYTSQDAVSEVAVDGDFRQEMHLDGDTIDTSVSAYDVQVKKEAIRFLCS